ncbi:MAG: hypothetical protein K2P35_01235, partial [Lachnospiraceae bacterium]|nr:hypothetical protein [Lachnospiraceae bacterium]
IVAIDYDPGTSEVNQLNRIKLMLSAAQKNPQKTEATVSEITKKTEKTQQTKQISATATGTETKKNTDSKTA